MKEQFIVVKLKAKPGVQSLLEKKLQDLAAATHSEPGCLLYALHRSANDPSLFIVIERFTSQEAFDSHLSSAHFKKYFPDISSLLTSSPELLPLDALGEGQKGRLFL